MDNGRLKMENYKGLLYCEAYLETEYTPDDIHRMVAEIRDKFTPPVDIILNKLGSYSLTVEAQKMLSTNIKEFGNFVYVVDNATKRASAKFAALSYMKSYNTSIAQTKEDAYGILRNGL